MAIILKGKENFFRLLNWESFDKCFNSFFALYRDVQSLIFCGALFHALVASLMNVDVDFSDVPSSMSFPSAS